VPDPDAADARSTHLHEVEQAVGVLYQATRARVKVLAERFDPDLQPAGFGILRYIIANEPIRAGDIASALAIDKSAVSRQLTILRDNGLVETRADPADGRATLLVASDAARAALETFRAESKADYERILQSWDSDDIATLATLLQRFNKSRS
jgi:DNA-binding MarR family transcriptional regulator